MKNYKVVEVILFSRYSFTDPRQRELVRWLGTTLQAAIKQQQELTMKLFLRTMKDTPPIYLS